MILLLLKHFLTIIGLVYNLIKKKQTATDLDHGSQYPPAAFRSARFHISTTVGDVESSFSCSSWAD